MERETRISVPQRNSLFIGGTPALVRTRRSSSASTAFRVSRTIQPKVAECHPQARASGDKVFMLTLNRENPQTSMIRKHRGRPRSRLSMPLTRGFGVHVKNSATFFEIPERIFVAATVATSRATRTNRPFCRPRP